MNGSYQSFRPQHVPAAVRWLGPSPFVPMTSSSCCSDCTACIPGRWQSASHVDCGAGMWRMPCITASTASCIQISAMLLATSRQTGCSGSVLAKVAACCSWSIVTPPQTLVLGRLCASLQASRACKTTQRSLTNATGLKCMTDYCGTLQF